MVNILSDNLETTIKYVIEKEEIRQRMAGIKSVRIL